MFCNSPAVVLGESLATQTLLLTVYHDIDTRPLPAIILIIALMVEMGISTALALSLKPLH